MHNLFYSNISELAGNWEGMLDEGTYKTTIQNMQKLGWKAQFFTSSDVSMLSPGCGVSQYPHFDDTIKNKYQILPRPYVGSYIYEKGNQFFTNHGLLHYIKSVETFIMVSMSDMKTSQYWQKLESMIDKAK